ncbi:metalloregulator ArsR/SmtB family transcription factor [Priestia megaterium]|uniref:ArsR/SmtB family transcription factor n=1 Tax=Priestia megaterium TaxID=1404 RepID=UPI002E1B6081|nr:metalloregulator ArsR/SmtB family transcription factor [Priestia megaterium]
MTSSAAKHDIFQAIADPTRRKVLELLSEKKLPISEITSHFSISRTAIVKHLHILSEADLVHGQKKGREKVYHLQPEALKEVQDWLSYYEQFWTNKLSILQHIVERDEERNQ